VIIRKKPMARRPMKLKPKATLKSRAVPPRGRLWPKRTTTRLRKVAKTATPEEKAHMGRVAKLPCDACLQEGNLTKPRIHHIREGYGTSQRASNWEVIPECEGHHQGMIDTSKAIAFHRAPRTFQIRYGSEISILKRTWEKLGMDFERFPEIAGFEPPWWRDYLRGAFDDALPPHLIEALTGPIGDTA
jgi:hypothetical protein